ncbi:MAG: DUF805 domain-containing protein [Xanthobacteraceae bacterium]|nr:DUF805 domain-containing protein [Xanthobacteraceae bacterium]
MNWSYLYTSFEGRIGRQTFWIALAAIGAVELAAHLLAYRIEGNRLSAIVDLAFSYPEFALLAKRGHDRNNPIWVVGLLFAGSIFLDFLVIFGWSEQLDNPNTIFVVIGVVWVFFALVLLVDLGFRRGTVGPNQYGPDPLANG